MLVKSFKLTQKEKQKRLKIIFNVKKMAEDGELPLTSDKSKQWIELIEKMHGRFEPLSSLSSDVFKELEKRPKPKLQQEKTLVYNLCNLYHYEYKKVDQNVIENLAQVILLSASDETIREWIKDIILDPPSRTREENGMRMLESLKWKKLKKNAKLINKKSMPEFRRQILMSPL